MAMHPGHAEARVIPLNERVCYCHADDETLRELDELSRIGLRTARALLATAGRPERFANGRQ